LVHGASPTLSTRTSRRGLDVDWIEAWAITEDLLAMFRTDVASRNARFILATLPTDILVHPAGGSVRHSSGRSAPTRYSIHSGALMLMGEK